MTAKKTDLLVAHETKQEKRPVSKINAFHRLLKRQETDSSVMLRMPLLFLF